MFQPIPIEPQIDLVAWLQTQAEINYCQWLLAHSLDCVIWGKFEHGKLQLGCDAAKLNFDTLQQCRIFGPKAEVLLWPNTNGWQAVVITDPVESDEYIDEWQMLWGIAGEPSKTFSGFTRLTDGIQGMQHTLPLLFEPQDRYFGQADDQQPKHRPARLKVRHILDFDSNTGAAYIRASRLVELSAKEIEHGDRS
ncbi:MAG: TIGR03984 family CRISPR-associated protein [Chloroflexi bacterium]|nr:TIGR03984 family CRISPR-associated protein [Chloroflexota bacterium]